MPVPIFIDRDGTLIEQVEFLASWDHLHFVPGAAQAVAAANRAGHPVVVATNQSGVARGYFTEAFVQATGVHLNELLAPMGARLDGYYYCPHHVDGKPPYTIDCPDRKPKPGMLLRAARELGLDLRGAYMIGDRNADMEVGAELGVIPLLVRTGYGAQTERLLGEDFAARGGRVFDHLPAAIRWILAREAGPVGV
jgi:D-glycero-D-manno-heptose 1,7-bisphosphate phosphatase